MKNLKNLIYTKAFLYKVKRGHKLPHSVILEAWSFEGYTVFPAGHASLYIPEVIMLRIDSCGTCMRMEMALYVIHSFLQDIDFRGCGHINHSYLLDL